MKRLSKKSEAGLVIVLILVILVFFFGWLVNVNQRECRSNKDCGNEAYCGSDFSCHTYPTIQKTVVQYNFLIPSIIIGIAIIIGAIIFKWNAQSHREDRIEAPANNAKETPEEVKDISGPYYHSDSKIRTP